MLDFNTFRSWRTEGHGGIKSNQQNEQWEGWRGVDGPVSWQPAMQTFRSEFNSQNYVNKPGRAVPLYNPLPGEMAETLESSDSQISQTGDSRLSNQKPRWRMNDACTWHGPAPSPFPCTCKHTCRNTYTHIKKKEWMVPEYVFSELYNTGVARSS